MKLARRFLHLLGGGHKTMTPRACACREPTFHFTDDQTVELGEDSHGAAISLSTCRLCGDLWLTYLIEWPHYSRSGRWWRVRVSPSEKQSVSIATARELIERAAEGFAGGSFFDSPGHPVTAPINVA